MYTRGLYMGQEFRGKGANVALGPVVGPLGKLCIRLRMLNESLMIDVGRNARGGRNWEGEFYPNRDAET